MTLAPGIETPPPRPAPEPPEALLGDDWDRQSAAAAPRRRRLPRGYIALNRSPLARKIIVFNLLALMVLLAGLLFLNPFRDGLVQQRGAALVAQAELVAGMVEAEVGGARLAEAAGALDGLVLREGVEVFLFDAAGSLVASHFGTRPEPAVAGLDRAPQSTVITDFLNGIWEALSALAPDRRDSMPPLGHADLAARLAAAALAGETRLETARDSTGHTVFTIATPVRRDGATVGVIAMTSAAGEIDRLVRNEREQVLQIFVLALLVSIGLSLVLASTIANPISDLAAAAESGHERSTRSVGPGRVSIPNLAARPDEIGRLSVAMRGMVAALYDRIEANEQFAADVAHEIKNPLASLRSAVGTLRLARRDDQRERLLDVIEHDVRRLDRLVSDIANASRLDSELVKEQEEQVDLLRLLGNLAEHLGREAEAKGVDFITDLPDEAIQLQGLEARLAQVFVNLIGNAISFCEAGDAVRVWARRRGNRVLVVVEDTGPGIPEAALTKIFKRFYSERPPDQFGQHSGLGLAISKQIVEAHGGVIWAENIRPTKADAASDPLGARFVVGLPL